ncbi:hypothetical protein GALMADRAFT_1091355 [Galerina marginata CBS 339.88]|uniref:Uncharacterized protein n=1 Tax=Galerina marginata (strain CBS 339.88) TaxID=685588 RepID=A0A067TKX4_GALM3|nr:hypothetical protein GALMADRAFT_1091355 [Galerina marginata CBS 339.88]
MVLYNRLSSVTRSKKTTHYPRPVDSIPIEILVLIFEEYCRACNSTDSLSHPELHITQVCKYWRSIVIHVPNLWTKLVITPHTPSRLVATYLQRSQQLPLDLEVDLRHDAADTAKREHALTTWMAIKSTSPRWRRLVLQIGPHDATVISEDLRELGTPLLEELRISSGSHVSGITKIFEGGAPSLKSLRLTGLSLERFTPSLHQLTRLHLASNCPIHFSSFQRLMTKMVKLQDLSLRSRVVEGWPIYPSQDDTILLPSLTSLKLSDRRWPLFIPLLSLSAPMLHTLSLSDLVAHDLPETFMESQLCENLPSLRNLVLRGKSSYIDDGSFAQLARIFPAIEHFSLLDVDEVFVRQSSRAMHQTAIWPKLHTITMNPVVAEDILCSLISARTTPATGTPLKTLVVPVPNRFKKIRWISQQLIVEECQHTPAFSFSHPVEAIPLNQCSTPSTTAPYP